MPKIDLSMLNQRQTPAFYADVLANRPAAGFIGRIFVSTDTYAFYRDNGTSWDLIGGPGTGTVTGTGTTGQVTYWNGASTITGSNNLFWDTANNRLGINNATPGASIDVHSAVSSIAQFNQTTATNNSLLVLQNSGSALWRLGNYYNAGANDFGVFDVVGAIQPLTIKKTSGQVLIGTSTVGSGKLVVASASSDNGIQIVGASAPSLRIDSAESGPTKRAGLGISTATNNFIQGSADRDFCIFNGSTAAASPILFGVYDAGAVNVQEAARISAARNFLIGTTTDNGNKFQVNGSAFFNSNLIVQAPASTLFMSLRGRSSDNFGFIGFYDNTGATRYGYIQSHSANGGQLNITADGGAQIIGDSRGLLLQPSAGNVGIGTTTPLTNLDLGATGSNNIIIRNTGSAYNLGYIGNPGGRVDIGFSNSNSSLSVLPYLSVTSAGNVGIGTTAPTSIFHVNTSSQLRGRFYSSGGASFLDIENAGGSFYVGKDNGTGSDFGVGAYSNVIWGVGAYPLVLTTNNSERARITSSGNLLIGTTTDNGNKLQVNGILTATSLRSQTVGTFGFNTASNGEFQIYATVADGMLIAGRGSTNDLILLNKNGSDVMRVPTGTTTANFLGSVNIANTVTAAVGIASTHKVSILINGVQYYLLASNV